MRTAVLDHRIATAECGRGKEDMTCLQHPVADRGRISIAELVDICHKPRSMNGNFAFMKDKAYKTSHRPSAEREIMIFSYTTVRMTHSLVGITVGPCTTPASKCFYHSCSRHRDDDSPEPRVQARPASEIAFETRKEGHEVSIGLSLDCCPSAVAQALPQKARNQGSSVDPELVGVICVLVDPIHDEAHITGQGGEIVGDEKLEIGPQRLSSIVCRCDLTVLPAI